MTDKNDYPHIIITGNPAEGFEFIGPFPSLRDACLYANSDPHMEADWWVAPCHEPADTEPASNPGFAAIERS
jgi:hypothetical protein